MTDGAPRGIDATCFGLVDDPRALYSADHGDNLGTHDREGKSAMCEESADMVIAAQLGHADARMAASQSGTQQLLFMPLAPKETLGIST